MEKDTPNSNWFEKHVVDTLTRLEKGQNDFITEFKTHIQSDSEQFEAIRLEAATSKASHEAIAKTSAKFWAGIGAGVSLVASSAVHFFFKNQ